MFVCRRKEVDDGQKTRRQRGNEGVWACSCRFYSLLSICRHTLIGRTWDVLVSLRRLCIDTPMHSNLFTAVLYSIGYLYQLHTIQRCTAVKTISGGRHKNLYKKLLKDGHQNTEEQKMTRKQDTTNQRLCHHQGTP